MLIGCSNLLLVSSHAYSLYLCQQLLSLCVQLQSPMRLRTVSLTISVACCVCSVCESVTSPHIQSSCYPKAFNQTHSTRTMSQVTPTAASSTNFESIFRTALQAYEKQTKKDIASHPLAAQLQSCNTPNAILSVLQAQVQVFNQSRSADERLTKWLNPTVNVLCAFSATLGQGVGMVCCENLICL